MKSDFPTAIGVAMIPPSRRLVVARHSSTTARLLVSPARSAAAMALTEVELTEIDFEALDKIYLTVPDYMKTIIATIVHPLNSSPTVARMTDSIIASAPGAAPMPSIMERICIIVCSTRPSSVPTPNAKTGSQAPVGRWQRGAGCTECNNTGYKGRIGVYEMLAVDSAMSAALGSERKKGTPFACRSVSV